MDPLGPRYPRPVEPLGYLHWLSDRLRPGASADALLAHLSELHAVATAFVTLALLEETAAEGFLTAERIRIASQLPAGTHLPVELTLRPTSAWGLGHLRASPARTLRSLPLRVATPWRSMGPAVVRWVVLTPAGLLCELQHAAGPSAEGFNQLEPVLTNLSIHDSEGHTYRLSFSRITTSPGGGSRSVQIHLDGQVDIQPSWLDVSPSPDGSDPLRVVFHPAPQLPNGLIPTPPGSPAERYLSRLLPALPPADPSATYGIGLRPSQAADLFATVADSLLAIGALPRHSRWLTCQPSAQSDWWVDRVSSQWARRALSQLDAYTSSGERPSVRPLGVALPLTKSTVVIEWLLVHRDTLLMSVYHAPEARGEYWPTAVPPLSLAAEDDAGSTYTFIGARYWHSREGEGRGDMLLWPPLERGTRSLRIHIKTLWETAWLDIDLASEPSSPRFYQLSEEVARQERHR